LRNNPHRSENRATAGNRTTGYLERSSTAFP